MKLNTATLAQLGATITYPTYPRHALRHGIVHIGVGGFHRAHEAVYTEHFLRLTQDQEWGICGIGLRENDRAMGQVLQNQDYLYSLMELGQAEHPSVQVIGAISDFLFAPDNPAAVLEKLAAPDTRIVSLTITEGGYMLDDHSGEFDFSHPDIVHDLAQPEAPRSVFGYLSAALATRRARNLPAFTLMSCDNLPHNGDKARHALLSFVTRQNPELARWIADNASFPNSMVDRITPITTSAHKELLRNHAGIDDAWPVVCEPFLQWVMEDDFCNGRPAWEKVGVQFTADVAPYERMKMRLLNASHSAMSYLGYLAGYRYSHEVMQDGRLSGFIRTFMDQDVTPTLGTIEGISLEQYKDTLIERFANPRIGDQLARLCMDGSSKIPKFILGTLEERLEAGAPVHRFALVLAGWALYLHEAEAPNADYKVEDPLAELLLSACAQRDGLSMRFLGLEDIFGPDLQACPGLVSAFESALHHLETQGVALTLAGLDQVA
ncbi:mannitol dehydrogenase family protein [Marinobacterium rhizophilum]|uniref:Mannitol dehydrogenase family protein n=1 Tax=Marinobacterium rhizophilum TaxID=420402 RepID=A0ABY5HE35_9GAMM|nr:mannitol dehydrogenase family protein [Marinobacterium rhizophilum]UTW10540.1 mannitol dehydrogenase family protein [Marinobacterium rhizophilum]